MISIIIPVYNVEKYFDRCLNSIKDQSYSDFEAILINDGSTDNSLKICERFVKEDSRFIVYDRINSGSSVSRNFGLEVAKGDYIGFIDSDDYIEKDYLKELYKSLIDNKADISLCSYNKNSSVCLFNEKKEIELFNNQELGNELIVKRSLGVVPWGRLFKKSVIGNTIFLTGRINEDDLFTFDVFSKAKKVVKINKPLYNYTYNPTGITYSNFNLKNIDILVISYERLKIIEKTWPNEFSMAMYIASCEFINIHKEFIKRGLYNNQDYANKLLKDREDLYQYLVKNSKYLRKKEYKKVLFYYKNKDSFMFDDKMLAIRVKIHDLIRKIVKGK